MTNEPRETRRSVLVVSEDPAFITGLQEKFEPLGIPVFGCLGPSQAPCLMDTNGYCSLAEHATVVLVDTPPSGVFGRWTVIPAGLYAERLARTHPKTFVVISEALLGVSGASGEIAHVKDRDAARKLLEWLMEPRLVLTSGI